MKSMFSQRRSRLGGRHSGAHSGHRHGHGHGGGRGGPRLRAGRMLSASEMQLLFLTLLEERPRHGYDLIKAIEELTAGAYVPSPGMVYPALSYLEESGLAAPQADGAKKLYSLTDSGATLLRDNRTQAAALIDALKRAGQRLDRAREAYDSTEGSATQSGAATLEAARRDLKAVLFDSLDAPADEQQRIAIILQRTIAEIRKR